MQFRSNYKDNLYRIDLIDSDGNILLFYTGKFLTHTNFAAASKKFNVPEKTIINIIEATGKNEEYQYYTHKANEENDTFRVRNIYKSLSIEYDSLAEAFENSKVNDVIEWQNENIAVCIDIDADNFPLPINRLYKDCLEMRPQAKYTFISQSGKGVHMLYEQSEVFTAMEFAAIAGYNILNKYPNLKVEFITRSRYPNDKKKFKANLESIDRGVLYDALFENVDLSITEWLNENELERGQRYSHNKCPVNPSVRALGNTPPVIVLDNYIHCFICEADGIYYGTRKPGLFPYSTLIGDNFSKIGVCAKNLVHWSHAKYIIRSLIENEFIGKNLYSAFCKLIHSDDMRINNIFTATEPFGLVRHNGYWTDKNSRHVNIKPGSNILKSLPACQIVNNNKITINNVAVEWLSNNIDLSNIGYYAVKPVHGMQLTQFQIAENKDIITVIDNIKDINRRPKYLVSNGNEEHNLEWAWQQIEKIFPKLDRKLVTALIAGRGCIENLSGMPPMLFVTGPTGSGKNSHTEVAASIVGDSVGIVHLNRDQDRFFNELINAKNRSGFVLLDEFFTFAKQSSFNDPITAIENILGFNENKITYMIYVGGVPFGHVPFFVLADTDIPSEVLMHQQIGRRLYHYRLRSSLHWEKGLTEYNIGTPGQLRARGSEDIVKACNIILSHVIDEFFLAPADYASIMDQLGIAKMNAGDMVEEYHKLIIDFYKRFMKAPEAADADKKRFGSNSKVCSLNLADPLYTALSALQTEDEQMTERCRLLEETDLQSILNTDNQVVFKFRRYGTKLGIKIQEML